MPITAGKNDVRQPSSPQTLKCVPKCLLLALPLFFVFLLTDRLEGKAKLLMKDTLLKYFVFKGYKNAAAMEYVPVEFCS